MKVILLEDIKGLGNTSEIKEVSDGYARNFLLPRKIAEAATESAIKKVERKKKEIKKMDEKALEKIQNLAQELDGREVVIKSKEKDGKLFGSIGTKEIVKELKTQGLKISNRMISIDNPIKEIGESDIKINFDHGIEATMKLIVEAE